MHAKGRVVVVAVTTAFLLTYASWFDFLCDDAFIAFRYAQHWVHHGQIVYNVGERVEGYTSFVWVLLLAMLHGVGISLPLASKLLGGLSALLLLVFTAQLAHRLLPNQLLSLAALLAMLAGNASVAAWTLGGLETPLYSALLVACLVALATWIERESPRAGIAAASVFAVATLTRPEAAMLFAVSMAWVAQRCLWLRRLPRGAVYLLVTYLCICGGYLMWRHSYYGDWLPNPFYVKTTGAASALRAGGIAYLRFCGAEFGEVFVAGLLGLASVAAWRFRHGDAARETILFSSLFFTLAMFGYIASIGGDFLDLYRFLVPTLPLIFAGAIVGIGEISRTLPGRLRRHPLGVVAALLFFSWYLPHQFRLARRAMQVAEEGRRQHGIEPLGWTRSYALRWAATGRWLAAHSVRGDSLAVGAAGAMPFYSGLPNVDTFGLCDHVVARYGRVIGSRPGHQRFATADYLIARAPTFLLIDDYATDTPSAMKRSPFWERQGYVRLRAEVTPEEHGAPNAFFHYILVKRERAEQ